MEIVNQFEFQNGKISQSQVPKASSLNKFLQTIRISEFVHQVDMTFAEWQEFLNLKIPELHDRLI
ncbi:MAG: hypothetical protein ACRD38_10545 [Nitrososphaerales archaeon]